MGWDGPVELSENGASWQACVGLGDKDGYVIRRMSPRFVVRKTPSLLLLGQDTRGAQSLIAVWPLDLLGDKLA